MDIAVNIGNSNLHIAAFSREIFQTWQVPARQDMILSGLTAILSGIVGQIERGILSSVNPKLTESVRHVLSDFCQTAPVIAELPTGFFLDYSGYRGNLGIDRAICCEAAFLQTPPPFLVVDLGTATTVNVIDANKRFAGGSILPGIRMSLSALSGNTAQLPHFDDLSEAPLIGRSTRDGMMAGVVRGAALYLDGVVSRIWEELHHTGGVVITGGNAGAVLPYLQTDFRHDPHLILKGLQTLLGRIAETQ